MKRGWKVTHKHDDWWNSSCQFKDSAVQDGGICESQEKAFLLCRDITHDGNVANDK